MEEQCFSFIFQVREENTEIMRWWSKVVATELAKIDEEIKVRLSIEVMIVRLRFDEVQVFILLFQGEYNSSGSSRQDSRIGAGIPRMLLRIFMHPLTKDVFPTEKYHLNGFYE